MLFDAQVSELSIIGKKQTHLKTLPEVNEKPFLIL